MNRNALFLPATLTGIVLMTGCPDPFEHLEIRTISFVPTCRGLCSSSDDARGVYFSDGSASTYLSETRPAVSDENLRNNFRRGRLTVVPYDWEVYNAWEVAMDVSHPDFGEGRLGTCRKNVPDNEGVPVSTLVNPSSNAPIRVDGDIVEVGNITIPGQDMRLRICTKTMDPNPFNMPVEANRFCGVVDPICTTRPGSAPSSIAPYCSQDCGVRITSDLATFTADVIDPPGIGVTGPPDIAVFKRLNTTYMTVNQSRRFTRPLVDYYSTVEPVGTRWSWTVPNASPDVFNTAFHPRLFVDAIRVVRIDGGEADPQEVGDIPVTRVWVREPPVGQSGLQGPGVEICAGSPLNVFDCPELRDFTPSTRRTRLDAAVSWDFELGAPCGGSCYVEFTVGVEGSASSQSALTVTPAFADLGTIYYGDAPYDAPGTFAVNNLGFLTDGVDDIWLEGDPELTLVSPVPNQPFSVPPQGQVPVDIRFTPQVGDAGVKRADLRVRMSNGFLARVSVVARGGGGLTISPPQVGLFEFPEQRRRRAFMLMNTQPNPVTITGVTMLGAIDPRDMRLFRSSNTNWIPLESPRLGETCTDPADLSECAPPELNQTCAVDADCGADLVCFNGSLCGFPGDPAELGETCANTSDCGPRLSCVGGRCEPDLILHQTGLLCQQGQCCAPDGPCHDFPITLQPNEAVAMRIAWFPRNINMTTGHASNPCAGQAIFATSHGDVTLGVRCGTTPAGGPGPLLPPLPFAVTDARPLPTDYAAFMYDEETDECYELPESAHELSGED